MAWETGNQLSRRGDENFNEQLLQVKGFIEEKEAKILLYKFLRENITFTADLVSGVQLFPFQHMAIKAMFETDYFMGVWCLDENEYVLTQNGFKKIKDIQIGEHVRSRHNLNKVYDKKTNPKEKGLAITLSSGDSFRAKIGHKVLTYNPQTAQFEFKQIQDLTTDDYLPIKQSTECWGDVDITKHSNYTNSPELYFALGYMIGDGYICKDGMHICTESQEVLDVFDVVKKQNNLKSYVRQRQGELFEYSFYNRELVEWLESIGFDRSKKAKDKVIPDALLQASRNNLAALISGIFSADGYCSVLQDGRYDDSTLSIKCGLKNTSLQLLRQIKMLLNNFGIESNLRKSGVSDAGVDYYDLVLSNDKHDLESFATSIDFIPIKKSKNLQSAIAADKKDYQTKYVPQFGEFLSAHGSCEKLRGSRGTWGKNYSQNKFSDIQNISNDLREIINNIKNENVVFSKINKIDDCETISVDISVENEECYVGNGFVHHNSRGMSKSFTTAIYAYLDALLNQGVEIGILSKSFRQAKMIFKKIEDIASKPGAAYLAQCITHKSKSNDEWLLEIGRSRIRALPLGDGEKLRGFRFHRIIIDEFALMPERIYNEVIIPFLSVVENPTQREALHNLETDLIGQGKMKEEDRHIWKNNKLIALSSASYKFEYMYKAYEQFEDLIRTGSTKQTEAHRVIMQFSYDCAPKQLYDQNLLDQAKSTMSQSQFDREFGSIFTDDSSGYFKTSKMAACTLKEGESPNIEVCGEVGAKYILAFDPSWADSESSDDFAMMVIKLNDDKKIGTVVHSYALSGTNLKQHIFYFYYLLTHFNIVSIVGDYNGGVQFINACNESSLFKKNKMNIKCLNTNFDDLEHYQEKIIEGKKEYNLQDKTICYLRKPTSQWIRLANELLQANFDHRRIFFASRAIDDAYNEQRNKKIPIQDIKFLRTSQSLERQTNAAKMIDFVEHQFDMMNLVKTQCSLIQITTSASGTQNFDLPPSLKRQTGPEKARKDSYSALVLGNWMVKLYYDMMNAKVDNVNYTFTPMFIN